MVHQSTHEVYKRQAKERRKKQIPTSYTPSKAGLSLAGTPKTKEHPKPTPTETP